MLTGIIKLNHVKSYKNLTRLAQSGQSCKIAHLCDELRAKPLKANLDKQLVFVCRSGLKLFTIESLDMM